MKVPSSLTDQDARNVPDQAIADPMRTQQLGRFCNQTVKGQGLVKHGVDTGHIFIVASMWRVIASIDSVGESKTRFPAFFCTGWQSSTTQRNENNTKRQWLEDQAAEVCSQLAAVQAHNTDLKTQLTAAQDAG